MSQLGDPTPPRAPVINDPVEPPNQTPEREIINDPDIPLEAPVDVTG